jgi:hypothetical protein
MRLFVIHKSIPLPPFHSMILSAKLMKNKKPDLTIIVKSGYGNVFSILFSFYQQGYGFNVRRTVGVAAFL